ncbi:hypothetical protein GOP47_0013258 [Adiantum capillus-veneris]|uniref:PUM-HD domain-containing protein n=1 Tax=Adiantum capillus-veneris TaxID=13818 RepID=A0A9D4UP45_ADICA|nr:hypothetical protein GOP47_0013258 [Adiantum capillus-veneris]
MDGNRKKPANRSLSKKKDQNRRGRFDAEKTRQKKSPFSPEKSRHSGQGADHTRAVRNIASSSLHPTRKKVDAETLQYFEEINSLLGTGTQVEDTEERMVLIENALEETHGKECELACEKSCSRVLEMLVLSSDSTQVASFLHRLSPSFLLVSTDAAGSHVAEALLKSASVILHEHDTEAAWFKTFDQAFTIICQVLGENIEEVICNCYGSHVVRSLLSVLSGVTLELSHKGSRGGGLSSRLSLSENPAASIKQGDMIFPHLLQLFSRRILGAAKERTIQLCMDPFASPVLQALLRVLAGERALVREALYILLGSDKEGANEEGKSSNQNLRQLMFDNYGSHLVEVMLEVASDHTYQEMFQQILTPHLLEYAVHPSANFVVQALIISMRSHNQVASLLSVLKPNFWTLIRGKRAGIITSLLKVCKKYQSSEQEVCSSLAKALNLDAASSSCLVLRLLFLEGYASSNGSKDWKPLLKERMSVLGCAMLQLIFTFPTECNQLFWLSWLNMEPAEILATIKDPGGCRVVESFLSSEIPSKHKNRLIAKLKGHFAELASQMLSAFTVEKCFRAGTIDLKEAIVSELVAIQSDLAKSKHGPHYIKRFDIIGDARYTNVISDVSKQGSEVK